MNDLQPYPAYQEVSLPWLDKIPSHWKIQRGKTIFDCVDIRSATGEEELLTVSSEHGIIPRSTANVTMFKAESYVGYKLCWPGDLVINSLWAWARGLGVSQHHGIISSAYGVYRLKQKFQNYSKYIHELVRSSSFQWELQVRSKGIWKSRLQLTDIAFLEAPFPLPPLDEQDAIARYLDWADGRIRRLIRARQKQIKLLEEHKQVIIQQAVTGQIDASTGKTYPAYKDSGVEWLGQVPEHWEIRRLRTIADIIFSNVDKHTKDDEIPVRLCNYVDVYKNEKISQNISFMKATASSSEIDRFLLKLDDVIITKDSEDWTDIGVPALVEYVANDLICAYHLALLRPSSNLLIGGYLLRSLQANIIAYQLYVSANGITRYGLTQNSVKDILTPLPPKNEQKKIALYLEKETERIDKSIEFDRQAIVTLKEYKTRLIADVVTGKVDVRQASASLSGLPALEEELEDDWEEDEGEEDFEEADDAE